MAANWSQLLVASPGGARVTASVDALLSQENLVRVNRLLSPGGVYLQFMHRYWMDDKLFFDVLRTLYSVFPYIEMYEMTTGDVAFVCSKQPLLVRKDNLDKIFSIPASHFLNQIGVLFPINLLFKRELSQQEIPNILNNHPGEMFSNFRPMLEVRALQAFLMKSKAVPIRSVFQRMDDPVFLAWIAKSLGKDSLTVSDYKLILRGILMSMDANAEAAFTIANKIVDTDESLIPDALEEFRYMEKRGLYNEFSFVVSRMLKWKPNSKFLACEFLKLQLRQPVKGLENDKQAERLENIALLQKITGVLSFLPDSINCYECSRKIK